MMVILDLNCGEWYIYSGSLLLLFLVQYIHGVCSIINGAPVHVEKTDDASGGTANPVGPLDWPPPPPPPEDYGAYPMRNLSCMNTCDFSLNISEQEASIFREVSNGEFLCIAVNTAKATKPMFEMVIQYSPMQQNSLPKMRARDAWFQMLFTQRRSYWTRKFLEVPIQRNQTTYVCPSDP